MKTYSKSGICIRVTGPLADKFPSRAPQDPSPPHATLLYVGEVDRVGLKKLVRIAKSVAAKLSPFEVVVKDYGEFENPEGQTIPHMIPVAARNGGLAEIHSVLRKLAERRGLTVEHVSGPFKPHITLGYNESGENYSGPKPTGNFEVESIEVWAAGKRQFSQSIAFGRSVKAGAMDPKRKIAGAIKLEPKQVLCPGFFVDSAGQEFELLPKDIASFFLHTQRLIEDRYRICGFSSHGTNDTTKRQSHWVDFELRKHDTFFMPGVGEMTGPTIWATPVAKDKEAAKLVLANDTSAVLAWGYPFGSEIYPTAITRIDHVGQGAVVTKQFRKVAAGAYDFSKAKFAIPVRSRNMELTELLKDIMEGDSEMGAQLKASLSSALSDAGALEEGGDVGASLSAVLSSYKKGMADDEGGEADPEEDLEDLIEDELDDDDLEEDALLEADNEEDDEEEEAKASTRKASASRPRKKKRDNDKVDELIRTVHLNALKGNIRAAQRKANKGTGAPLGRKKVKAVIARFNSLSPMIGPKKAARLAKELLVSELKVALLSSAGAAALKGARPAERKSSPEPEKFVAPTGKDNPLVARR